MINKSKKHGGLGIKNIHKMNISLLCKWWRKLEVEEGLWQQIVRHKYLLNDTVGTMKCRLDDSLMWRDPLKIKSLYLKGRTMTAKDGKATSFWLDTWILDRPLCSLYPVLFDMCLDKHISVHQFLVLHGQIKLQQMVKPTSFRAVDECGWHSLSTSL